MSKLLDTLIEERRRKAIEYAEYLARIVELTKQVHDPSGGAAYPKSLDTPAKRALYDNLGNDEQLAVAIDRAVRLTKKDSWRGNKRKIKEVRNAICQHLPDETLTDEILELVKNQDEY
jgi:type I restriction enzyme R subunit